LILLGDNYYGPLDGVESLRWKNEFEDMYPSSLFPGPCYAVLGNHDYDDQPGGGAKFQLEYSKVSGSRWKMPDLWYRVDFPTLTMLFVNTHYKCLSAEQIAMQNAWLKKEMTSVRTRPWLMVSGHHPVLSAGENHGDSDYLAPWRDLFNENGVDAYLCGHEHDLQHLKEEGQPTHWLVSGAGGQNLHTLMKDKRKKFGKVMHGFLHLKVSVHQWSAIFVGDNAQVLYRLDSPT